MTSFYRPRPASELPNHQHLFNYRTFKTISNETPRSSAEEESELPKMWAYPTREEVGWFFDEQINQTVFKRGKLSSKVQARFEEIGKWLKVHCEPQIMELEKRMDAMLREREVKSLRAKPRKVKNLRAKPKRPVNIKKEVVHPHLIPLEDWLNLKNQGGKKELLAYRQKMWASEAGPMMVQDGEKMFVRILGLSPMDPLMRNSVLAREGKIVDTAEGKLQGVEKEVEISCCFHLSQ